MRVSNSQYAAVLSLLEKGDAQRAALNFMAYLRQRGEARRLPAILAALQERQEAAEQRLSLELVSAHPLAPAEKKKIQHKAERLFPGKRIELRESVDPDVIGGFRLRGRESEYDATVARALRALNDQLQS